MIYAYDDWVQLPTMDLYDTQTMAMAINAAKDMYDRGEKRIDDFYEKYGDFMSPFARDMETYGKMMSNINNKLDWMYKNGIDPLRSVEGRSMVAQLTRSIDPAEYNRMRTNAKLGFEYLKNIEEAKAKNEFSQEFEDYLLDPKRGGPGRFSDFSSAGGAMWNRPGPGRYQTVDELIEPIVKNVDYTFDEAMTKAHNDGNNYYSITRDRLAKAIDDNMSDILATQSGGFHYWKALQAAGGDKDLAKQIFNLQIGNRLSDHEKVKFEADPFKLDTHRSMNNRREHAANKAVDYYYSILPYADTDGDGKLSKEERGNYAKVKQASLLKGNKKEESHNIFREAEALAPVTTGAHTWQNRAGSHVGYNPAKQGKQLIDPLVPADIRTGVDANKQKTVIPSSIQNNSESSKFTFVPSGAIKAKYNGYGYNYYVRGTIDGNNATDNSNIVWIPVKERGYVYGQE